MLSKLRQMQHEDCWKEIMPHKHVFHIVLLESTSRVLSEFGRTSAILEDLPAVMGRACQVIVMSMRITSRGYSLLLWQEGSVGWCW